MGMLERYNKPGGFFQLLSLLESCGESKREKFMKMILDENPYWHDAIKQRLLTFETIINWPTDVLAEITTRAQPLTIAAISQGLNEAQLKNFFISLSHSQLAKIRELSASNKFTPIQISSSIDKLLGEIRNHIQSGIVKLEKFAPHLVIPESFEAQLASLRQENFSAGSSEEHFTVKPEVVTLRNLEQLPEEVREQLEALRNQNQKLQSEMQALRKMNAVMREKLDQIKKIA